MFNFISFFENYPLFINVSICYESVTTNINKVCHCDKVTHSQSTIYKSFAFRKILTKAFYYGNITIFLWLNHHILLKAKSLFKAISILNSILISIIYTISILKAKHLYRIHSYKVLE